MHSSHKREAILYIKVINVKWPEVVSSTQTPPMGDETSVWKTCAKACCSIEIGCNILGHFNEYYWLLQSERA